MIVDVRDSHERDVKDFISSFESEKQTWKVPRVDLEYGELVSGCFHKDLLTRDIWVLCLCQRGLRSGMAMRFLKKEGF